MARMARVVVPGEPHHVTQRGVRRMETFFEAADYRAYLELLAEARGRTGVACWAYWGEKGSGTFMHQRLPGSKASRALATHQ